MKAVGIIAEYNPFHNGHAYQIRQAKERSGADFAVIAMSGNYVQRGTPAIVDKFTRTSMALAGGADFVFELPTLFATSSAQYFARAGVALFDALRCIDAISFGCETPDHTLLSRAASVLADEPAAYRTLLSGFLAQGMNFPAAREQAITRFLGSAYAPLVQSPNNILALEYETALQSQSSKLAPLPILRSDFGYHSKKLSSGHFCSAAAIRKFLSEEPDARTAAKTLSGTIPDAASSLLFSPEQCFLTEEDFSQMLYYKLLSERQNGFFDYADSSKELSGRICGRLSQFTGYRDFCASIKSRDVTYTRVSRLLLHILFDMRNDALFDAVRCGYVPYLRLLGFRRPALPFLRKIKKHAAVPLITKPARHARILAEWQNSHPAFPLKTALFLFQKDLFASDLYYGILAQKSGKMQKNECRRAICIR